MFDAIIVGAGGAGLSSAISLSKHTNNFFVITAGGIFHSNTAKAHGGIQISVLPEDSPELHFEDTYIGGNYKGKKELIRIMTDNSTNLLYWLNTLGMDFDKFDDTYIVKKCEGISVPRILSKKGHIGISIIRALYSEVKKIGIKIMNWTVLKEIHKANDFFILVISHGKRVQRLKTRNVILCCGGRSKQYAELNGYGSTNQAITDFQFYESLRKLGLKMVDDDSFQFHPACISLKGKLNGTPIPETLRSSGSKILDVNGKPIKTDGLKRDELSKELIKAIKQGRAAKTNKFEYDSFYLDLKPALGENKNFLDTFKFLFTRLKHNGIDPYKDLIPVTPMVHYQNGGIEINTFCETSIDRIYAAGEITGGIHGTNRLMGNSLLDILTYGKIAGESCGRTIK
ncbi:MAG: FAD-binding protein [Nitrospirae bacterium]|nr:FAD-binding protein [Nitrospirota bacterium]